MFKALQAAAAAAGANLTFIMAGWFPEPGHQEHYETAAHARAPDVDIRFADGNDKVMLADLWAGADIFLSLVDNIQETFGLTPLEAMAAGLPVVARQFHDLTTHHSAIRTVAPETPASIIRHPVKGDPFRDFAPLATHVLAVDTLLTPVPDVSADHIRRIGTARLDAAFSAYRATPALCADPSTLISERGGATVREILLAFPVGQRRALEMGLAWMAKYGFVE